MFQPSPYSFVFPCSLLRIFDFDFDFLLLLFKLLLSFCSKTFSKLILGASSSISIDPANSFLGSLYCLLLIDDTSASIQLRSGSNTSMLRLIVIGLSSLASFQLISLLRFLKLRAHITASPNHPRPMAIIRQPFRLSHQIKIKELEHNIINQMVSKLFSIKFASSVCQVLHDAKVKSKLRVSEVVVNIFMLFFIDLINQISDLFILNWNDHRPMDTLLSTWFMKLQRISGQNFIDMFWHGINFCIKLSLNFNHILLISFCDQIDSQTYLSIPTTALGRPISINSYMRLITSARSINFYLKLRILSGKVVEYISIEQLGLRQLTISYTSRSNCLKVSYQFHLVQRIRICQEGYHTYHCLIDFWKCFFQLSTILRRIYFFKILSWQLKDYFKIWINHQYVNYG